MCGIHELVKAEFMEKSVSLFSVSIKDGRFLFLEEFFISLDRVRLRCVTIWRLLYAKEMTFKGKDGSTSIL